MQIVDRAGLLAVLAVDEVVDHARLQRTGPEQRQDRDEIVETIRLETFYQIAHTGRLELEHGRRAAAAQELVRLRIVDRQRIDVDRRLPFSLARVVHGTQRPIDDRQRLQAEKIELDETDRLDVVLVELRQRRAARLVIDRHELRQRLRRDDDAASVRTSVAREPLERAREIDQRPYLLVLLVELAQLVLIGQRFFESDTNLERNQLRDAIDVTVWVTEHAAYVTDDSTRRHRSERNDLRDVIATIALRDVVDDPIAAVDTKVDVEIGHRDALGVQEALEQQIVLDRIEIGDAQRIRHQRARAGAATRADRDIVLASPANKVGDDQEVSFEPHPANRLELPVEPLAIRLGRGRIDP